jgi:hypothetical protein
VMKWCPMVKWDTGLERLLTRLLDEGDKKLTGAGRAPMLFRLLRLHCPLLPLLLRLLMATLLLNPEALLLSQLLLRFVFVVFITSDAVVCACSADYVMVDVGSVREMLLSAIRLQNARAEALASTVPDSSSEVGEVCALGLVGGVCGVGEWWTACPVLVTLPWRRGCAESLAPSPCRAGGGGVKSSRSPLVASRSVCVESLCECVGGAIVERLPSAAR